MNTNSRTKNSIRNIATSFIIQILMIIIKFVCRTVFIYTLGKSYLGINGLFSDILTMLSLAELGIDTAINFKLYKPLADNDVVTLQKIMKFYKLVYFLVGLTIFVIGCILIPFLPYMINDYETLAPLGINPELIFGLYLMQSSLSYLFFASDSAIIKADQKEFLVNITIFVCTVAMNAFQIMCLLIWKNFIAYVALGCGFYVIQNCVNAIIAHRKYPEVFKRTKERLTKAEIKDIFKDLGALSITKVNQVVLKATDNLVLSAFIGLTIVGLYSNYLLIYTTINTVLHKFFSASKASMGNLYTSDDIEKKYGFFSSMNLISVILYGTAMVGVVVVGDELISAWAGADYVIAQPFALLLGVEILIMGIKQSLIQIREVSGLFRQLWYRPIIGIVVNIIVSVVLVQFIGIYGVLLGTIVADVVANLCIDPWIIHKYAFKGQKKAITYYGKLFMYLAILFMVGAGDYLICKYFITDIGWLSVIVHVIICGITVPGVLLFVFCKTAEAKYAFNIVKRLLHKKAKVK